MLLCPREGLPTLALHPAFEGPAEATIQSVYLLKARAGLPGKRLGLLGENQQLCWDGHQPPPGQIDTRRAKHTLGAQPFCLAQIVIHRALGLGLKSSILSSSCPEHCRDGLDSKTVPDAGLAASPDWSDAQPGGHRVTLRPSRLWRPRPPHRGLSNPALLLHPQHRHPCLLSLRRGACQAPAELSSWPGGSLPEPHPPQCKFYQHKSRFPAASVTLRTAPLQTLFTRGSLGSAGHTAQAPSLSPAGRQACLHVTSSAGHGVELCPPKTCWGPTLQGLRRGPSLGTGPVRGGRVR